MTIVSLFLLMFLCLAGLALMALAVGVFSAVKLAGFLTHGLHGMLGIVLVLIVAIFVIRADRLQRIADREPAPPVPPLAQEHDLAPELSVLDHSFEDDSESLAMDFGRVQDHDSGDGTPLSIVEMHRDARGRATRVRTLREIPEWVQIPPTAMSPNDPVLIVHSQRFATREEARAQLEESARQTLLRRLGPRIPHLRRWPDTTGDVESSGIVRRECVVKWPLEVGGFQESVYQVHWELRFFPQAEERLFQAAKEEAVQQRLTRLAKAFVAVTLLLAAGSFLVLRTSSVQ